MSLLEGGLGAAFRLLGGRRASGDPVPPPDIFPVGFNFGIPPANKPPNPGGLPFIRPLLEFSDAELLFFPSTRGALLSFVTAFFNFAPERIEANNMFLLSASFLLSWGGSTLAKLNVGGGGGPGGGGGGGIFSY